MKLKNEVWQVNTTGISGVDAKTDIAMGTSEDGKPAIRIGENVVTGEGGGGESLPPVTEEDDGKILGVVNGKWNKTDAPSGLPEYTLDDDGKALSVGKKDLGPGSVLHFKESYTFTELQNFYSGDPSDFRGFRLVDNPDNNVSVWFVDGDTMSLNIEPAYYYEVVLDHPEESGWKDWETEEKIHFVPEYTILDEEYEFRNMTNFNEIYPLLDMSKEDLELRFTSGLPENTENDSNKLVSSTNDFTGQKMYFKDHYEASEIEDFIYAFAQNTVAAAIDNTEGIGATMGEQDPILTIQLASGERFSYIIAYGHWYLDNEPADAPVYTINNQNLYTFVGITNFDDFNVLLAKPLHPNTKYTLGPKHFDVVIDSGTDSGLVYTYGGYKDLAGYHRCVSDHVPATLSCMFVDFTDSYPLIYSSIDSETKEIVLKFGDSETSENHLTCKPEGTIENRWPE